MPLPLMAVMQIPWSVHPSSPLYHDSSEIHTSCNAYALRCHATTATLHPLPRNHCNIASALHCALSSAQQAA
jgi:hypothetical protein